MVQIESEKNGKCSNYNRREQEALVLRGRGKRSGRSLGCLVASRSWKRTTLAIKSARIEFPDLLVATGKEEINDVRDDGRDLGEEALLAV